MKTAVLSAAILGALSALATAPAHAQTTVKIAFAGPLTGPIAHIGKDEEYGARLALEDANAKGVTIGGQKVRFELQAEDDMADVLAAGVGARQGFLDHQGAQLGGRDVLEAAAKGANGGAHCADDDDFSAHGWLR